VPLLKNVTVTDAVVQAARKRLLEWNFVLDRESVPATIYEFWALKLGPLAFAPRVPEQARSSVRQYDMRRIIAWMKNPDPKSGPTAIEGRNRILVQALEAGVADLRKRYGTDMNAWKWGTIHTTDFVHPLAAPSDPKDLFYIEPVRRGGDSFTVQAASSPTETSTKQTSGASFMFVMDVKEWDNSTALSVPGNSAQPLSPHYQDLTPYWGEGKHFPLAFSRTKVEQNTKNRLTLVPARGSQ
jgi:penicillin amidase